MDRPAAMSTLALFWPHPRLAAACDPLAIARRRPEELVALATVHDEVRDALVRATPHHLWAAQHAGEVTAWEALFGWPQAEGTHGEAVSFDALHVGTRPRGAERGKPGVRRSKGQAHPTAVGVPRESCSPRSGGRGSRELGRATGGGALPFILGSGTCGA